MKFQKTSFIQNETYCLKELLVVFRVIVGVKRGHYTAYTYRSNDLWELCNDLRDYTSVPGNNKKIELIIIYIFIKIIYEMFLL